MALNFNFSFPWRTPLIILLILTTPSTAVSSPPPQPPPISAPKPSMAVVVGLLTTVFSITFLLLLYAKHCRRSHTRYPPEAMYAAGRKNSGIDRIIIESLPVFRFGSLSGQKDGLECAVCLTRFDPSEVLRLLPKCKHAFHVECVDTWLDAHSTCPLCRYRVDPEDIFLVLHENETEEQRELSVRRVSGRHSSAGEQVTGLQISCEPSATGSRRSLDSAKNKKKSTKPKKDETTPYRKDGLLLAEKRLDHRIIVGSGGVHRWSDVQPSDSLYLRTEMILSDSRRSRGSRPSVWNERNNGWWQKPQSGRGVINSRSVSEITGLSRFGSNEEAGVLSRWLAWVSEPKSQPAVFRSGRNSATSNV